jgi:uncharacterized protein YlxW (UPF0749 family)
VWRSPACSSRVKLLHQALKPGPVFASALTLRCVLCAILHLVVHQQEKMEDRERELIDARRSRQELEDELDKITAQLRALQSKIHVFETSQTRHRIKEVEWRTGEAV